MSPEDLSVPQKCSKQEKDGAQSQRPPLQILLSICIHWNLLKAISSPRHIEETFIVAFSIIRLHFLCRQSTPKKLNLKLDIFNPGIGAYVC